MSKVVIDEDAIEAVGGVLRSGQLRAGVQCAAFETEFALAVGCRHALAVSSGTAALQIAYQILLHRGDEVLVPSFTFFATAGMIAAIGAVPVFCDVDPETMTIDVAASAARVTARTRAIAPVHLFGNPVDVAGVRRLAATHRLSIIWDAAQAHGAQYAGTDVGSFDDVVCYSFYPSKNMTTGEGGMICTNRDYLADAARLLRSQGQPSRYVHTELGFNFRLTDIQAAIGRSQLARLPVGTAARRRNAAYLQHRLGGIEQLRVQREQANGLHSYHQFTISVNEAFGRERLSRALKARGVATDVYYPTPLHLQPVFERYGPISLPASEALARQVLSLPIHPHLDKSDLEFIADSVIAAFETLCRSAPHTSV